MNGTYDVISVGGGVAGSSVAFAMARSGYRVLILERETAFRDRVRGEWLAPWGVEEAESLGLGDALRAAGAHRLPDLAGRSHKPRPVQSPGGAAPLTFYHPNLQEAVLQAAVDAGAEVTRGARVIHVADGDPARVDYKLDRDMHSVFARVVVGADGRSSLVRRAIGHEPRTHRASRLLAGVRVGGIAGDPDVGHSIIREDLGQIVWLFPQGGGYARVFVTEHGAGASRYGGAEGYQRFINSVIELGIPAELLENTYQAGPMAAFVADDTWIEHPGRGRLLLVGDAAGVTDPTWGMGLSLAFRDAREVAHALQSHNDWTTAVQAYASSRHGYFDTIRTIENWHAELHLTPGPEASVRRRHAMRLWAEDPSRILDLPALGPANDMSEAARQRFFGEDVPAPGPQEAVAVNSLQTTADAFLGALRSRDFHTLEAVLGPEMRTRALLPGGGYELHGAERTRDIFARWFAEVEEFRMEDVRCDTVADRLEMNWRAVVRWPGEPFHRVVAQHAYAKVHDGHIVVLDLVCSGFRPLEMQAASA